MRLQPSKVSVFVFLCNLALGTGLWGQDQGTQREPIDLITQDGLNLLAIKYSNAAANPEWGCVIMHPAGDSRRDWRLPYFARAGFVCIGMSSRYLRDVAHEFYEPIMLDIAAGVKHLREVEKVKRIFLLGHSGGGSLMTLYAHQSSKPSGERFKAPVSGNPVDWKLLGYDKMPGPGSLLRPMPDLNAYELPPVDLLIVSSAHFGAGWAMVRKIDPSLTDEEDPTSLDPELDMYNPANGFKTPPQSGNGQQPVNQHVTVGDGPASDLNLLVQGEVFELWLLLHRSVPGSGRSRGGRQFHHETRSGQLQSLFPPLLHHTRVSD